MIYFLHGTDTERMRAARDRVVAALRAKRPDAVIVSYDMESVSDIILEECVGSQGLFDRKLIVLLRDISSADQLADGVKPWITPMAQSENMFVWMEYKVSEALRRLICDASFRAESYEAPPDGTNERRLNTFAIADAFGCKDKKRMWLLLREMLGAGVPAEEVHGTLHWQIRTIMAALCHPNATAAELGMKPFALQKARRYAKHFTCKDIGRHSRALLRMYHQARAGGEPLDIALERWVLTLR